MKRRPLLIAACTFAAVSLGLNAWLLMLRKDRSSAAGTAPPRPSQDVPAIPALQPVAMDFSDTAFADGSWKLTDGSEPAISPGTFEELEGGHQVGMWRFGDATKPGGDSPLSLDKAFKWEDVPLAGRPGERNEQPALASSSRTGAVNDPPPAKREHSEPESLPEFDPNDLRSKALLVTPPER